MNKLVVFMLAANLALTGLVAFHKVKPPVVSFPIIKQDSKVSFTYKCELVEVIDGDTVEVNIDLGFDQWIHEQRIRLYGMDAPETRTKDLEEKARGLESKKWLEDRLKGQEVVIQSLQNKEGDNEKRELPSLARNPIRCHRKRWHRNSRKREQRDGYPGLSC